jgi:excisionase family DNA binding protein
MLDNIIGVEEAAAILGLSPGTVKNKCAAGELPAKKIGKTWIIDKTQLEEEKKMKTVNYTKMNGQRYVLPEGFYAVEGRFGDQVYNERSENVTSKIMGNAKSDGYIIYTDKGIADLKVLK